MLEQHGLTRAPSQTYSVGMRTIVLTGFEPFDRAAANPSWDAVRLVAERWNRPEHLVTACLPVAFGAAGATIRALVAEHPSDVVVATGLADGRSTVSLERVAINVDDARIPDNDGAQPIDVPIASEGPAAYFSTLPIKAATDAVLALGIPAAVSQTAGTYVCNHVFYEVMRVVRPGVVAGFVHVPAADVVSVEDAARALEAVLVEALTRTVDLVISGGAVS